MVKGFIYRSMVYLSGSILGERRGRRFDIVYSGSLIHVSPMLPGHLDCLLIVYPSTVESFFLLLLAEEVHHHGLTPGRRRALGSQGAGLKVQGSGLRAQGLGLRTQGLGLKV